MSHSHILIAGVGNVFKGDDGFGCAVARAFSTTKLSENVAVVDFGIRGVDLAFAVSGGWDFVILVDALPRGGDPGRVFTLELDPDGLDGSADAAQGHNFDPLSVFQWAARAAGELPHIYIVGCEPLHIPEEDDLFEGLSPPVDAAVGEAVDAVLGLIDQINDQTQASAVSTASRLDAIDECQRHVS